MVEKTLFKIEFSTMNTNSSEGTFIETSDYHLNRDKVMKDIVVSQRKKYASLGSYAFNVAEGLQNS